MKKEEQIRMLLHPEKYTDEQHVGRGEYSCA